MAAPSMAIPEALDAMSSLVQRGEFAAAEAVGAAAAPPLALPRAALERARALSDGAQAAVYEARLLLDQLEPATRAAVCADLRRVEAEDRRSGGGAAAADTGGAADEGAPRVAVKRATIREAADLVRFRSEVRCLAALRGCPHVAALLGARMLPPDYVAVLALAGGGSAAGAAADGWRPGPRRVAALGAQLARALGAAHAAGLVHRDVKPANILLDAPRRAARLGDFGLAARAAEAAAPPPAAGPSGGFHRRRVVGTLEYLAPEVLLKRPHTPAADVYALGVALAELGSGAVPYSDCARADPLAHTVLEMGYGRAELAAAVAAGGLRPALPPGWPAPLAALARECWRAEPGERPAAAALADALERVAAALPPDDDDGGGEGRAPGGAAADEPGAAASGPAPTTPLELCMLPAARRLPPWWGDGGAGGGDPTFVLGSFADPGARGEDRMEDRCVVLRALFGLPGVAAMAVFDGHRGAECAEYLAAHLEAHLAARWLSAPSPAALLAGALADADAAFRAAQDAAWARRGGGAAGRPWPGATATLALLAPPGRLALAWLGDSAAVLVRCGDDGGAPHHELLTRDHTADDERERARVAAAGGALARRAGGWRVGPPGLQVTRSVGDADLKGCGVTAEAETAELALPRGAAAVVAAATDGVWETLAPADAARLVRDTVKHPAMCARRLVAEALARGGGDNAAAVVAVVRWGGGGAGGEGGSERVF